MNQNMIMFKKSYCSTPWLLLIMTKKMKLIYSVVVFFMSFITSAQQTNADSLKIESFIYDQKEGLKIYCVKPINYDAHKKYAAIIIFHGGGWSIGEPSWGFSTAKHYASLGMIAFSAQYRLEDSKKGFTPYESVLDAQKAIRWIRENAKNFSINEHKIAAYGWSAGAHLAACASVFENLHAENEKTSSAPNLLLLKSPALTLSGYSNFQRRLKGKVNVLDISPAESVSKNVPPTMIVIGRDDTVTPLKGSELFKKNMDRYGNECELIIYDDVGHLFTPSTEPDDGWPNPDMKIVRDTQSQFDKFLKKHNYIRQKESIRSINGSSIEIDAMDRFLKQQMDSLEIPGLSFAYVNDDKVVYSNNLGVVNTKTQEPVTAKTLFDAASISKTVFSFFIMQMVDKGLIDLDTPLYTYLENPDIAYDERYKKITARMALSHTTGFPNWRYLNDKGQYDPNGKLRIAFDPGTQYQYSGEGFKYLAQVIAHLLNTDMNGLQEKIAANLLNPLEMGKSSFVWNSHLEKHRADGHINGEPNAGWSISSKYPNFNAAASLQTNAVAYGNFLSALINGKLLSENSHKEMLKVQSSRLKTEKKPGVKYGLGIIINASPYGTNFAHTGNNGSSTSQFFFNKKHKSGYVFFTNMEGDRMFQFDTNLKKFLLKKE